MAFYLYKGLKKPLVFFGLKNKYIYHAISFIATGIFCVAILSSIIGFIGTILGFIVAGGGIWYTFQKQDKNGLYNKTKNNKELHVFPRKFKTKKILKNHSKK